MDNNSKDSQVPSDSVRKLSFRQLRAITFLISSATQEEACRHAEVSRETVNKWRKDPLFREELEKQREVVFSEAMGILKQAVSQAVITLRNLLSSENEAVRLRACVHCVLLGLKVRDQIELEDRVRSLEEAAQAQLARNRGGSRWT